MPLNWTNFENEIPKAKKSTIAIAIQMKQPESEHQNWMECNPTGCDLNVFQFSFDDLQRKNSNRNEQNRLNSWVKRRPNIGFSTFSTQLSIFRFFRIEPLNASAATLKICISKRRLKHFIHIHEYIICIVEPVNLAKVQEVIFISLAAATFAFILTLRSAKQYLPTLSFSLSQYIYFFFLETLFLSNSFLMSVYACVRASVCLCVCVCLSFAIRWVFGRIQWNQKKVY